MEGGWEAGVLRGVSRRDGGREWGGRASTLKPFSEVTGEQARLCVPPRET